MDREVDSAHGSGTLVVLHIVKIVLLIAIAIFFYFCCCCKKGTCEKQLSPPAPPAPPAPVAQKLTPEQPKETPKAARPQPIPAVPAATEVPPTVPVVEKQAPVEVSRTEALPPPPPLVCDENDPRRDCACEAMRRNFDVGNDIKALIKTRVLLGNDSCSVMKCAFEAGGDVRQVLAGALDAEISRDLVAKCAIENGIDPQIVSDMLQLYAETTAETYLFPDWPNWPTVIVLPQTPQMSPSGF